MIMNNLIGFIGTVVNIDGVDNNFGKVQVHILGDQGDTLNQDDYLWAMIMMPTTSPAENGVGITPNWLNVNTTVFGVFLDGHHKSIPIILGSLNQNKPTGNGISNLASGEQIQRTLSSYEKQIGVETKRNPNYKNNKVITTSSKEEPNIINHVIELDDTNGSERILVKHKKGSYVEFLPDGKLVLKGTSVHIVGNNAIRGDVDIESKTVSIVADEINIQADVSITGNVAVVGMMTLNGLPVQTT